MGRLASFVAITRVPGMSLTLTDNTSVHWASVIFIECNATNISLVMMTRNEIWGQHSVTDPEDKFAVNRPVDC